jgi:hypothetical protein
MMIKEGQMANPNQSKHISSIRLFDLTTQVLWIVGLIAMSFWVVFIPVAFFHTPDRKSLFNLASAVLYFRGLFSAGILLWILYHLRKLGRMMSSGQPFDLINPRRIRKIAYGVFAWIPVGIIGEYLLGPVKGPRTWWDIMSLLWQRLFVLAFLGLVILVIAKVFEVGVRLQQDQNLTV